MNKLYNYLVLIIAIILVYTVEYVDIDWPMSIKIIGSIFAVIGIIALVSRIIDLVHED